MIRQKSPWAKLEVKMFFGPHFKRTEVVKLGYNEQNTRFQISILVHKSTRLWRTNLVSPELFVLTEFHCILYATYHNGKENIEQLGIQSNLCTTTTLRTPNLWPLLTGSEVVIIPKNRDSKMVAVIDKWSLFGGDLVSSGFTVFLFQIFILPFLW